MAKGGKPEEMVKRLKYTLECSICMETYTDPRILDCVHSFCFKCIRTHVGTSRVIKCPLCNKESPVPVEKGIEGLKSNFLINGLINDIINKEEKKGEPVPAVCGSCDLGNVAKSHCDDCDCELCDQCVQQHRQLKVLKLHKVTLYPTDEEIKAQKEAMVSREVIHIQSHIAANISELQTKILQVQVKIQTTNIKRDRTISQVNEAYQRCLEKMEKYVHGLTDRIKENAENILGDLTDQLITYGNQLTTFQTFEKKQKHMLDLDLDEKVKLCKELDEQIKKHKVRPLQSLSSCDPFVNLPKLEFVPENIEVEMDPLLEQAIGFLTPIKNRCTREIDITRSEMPNKMADYAVECAHDALDKYAIYQSTQEILCKMAEKIRDKFAQRYNRGKWSCCVAKANVGYDVYWEKFLSFHIDNYYIILMEESD